jgi:hypothetical protein
LLPHFELGDPNPAGSTGTTNWQRGYLATADSRWDRTGEDVIATDLLSFDVRGFDRTAPIFVTSGPDNLPGAAGVDDDGVGGQDTSTTTAFGVSTELGSIGSDDELVEVSDLGIYPLIAQPILDPTLPATFGVDNQALATNGAFVDLLYPYLAGSPLQERTAATGIVSTPPNPSVTTIAQVTTNYNAFMQSDLSLFPIPVATPTNGLNSLKRSGKLVHTNDVSGNIQYMQPVYDTWTDAYESDGFDQTHTQSGALAGNQVGTTWVLNNIGGLAPVPRMPGTPVPAVQIDTGRLIPDEPETSPPFAKALPAISATIRALDPQTEEMIEFTIVQSLQ